MAIVSSRDLRGKAVFSQDGIQLGDVEGMELNHESWQVLGFDVKLRRDVLADMSLKKPMMGTQTVVVAPDQISGVGDAIILRAAITSVEHSGGKSA